jgi:phospholipase/carboxylesterase
MPLICDLALPKPGLPLAVVLHGLGDTRQGWQPVAPMLGLDGWGWCFAEAPDPYHGGASWFDLDLDAEVRVDAAGVRRSHALLVELLASLESRHGIACEQVALLGFSQGCLMALEVALRHPRPLLATVAISGWLHREDEWPAAFGPALQRQRILATHGRLDPVVPYGLAERRVRRLQALGAPIRWQAYDKEHGLDPEDELPAIRRHLLDAAATPPQPAAPAPGATP